MLEKKMGLERKGPRYGDYKYGLAAAWDHGFAER